MLVLASFILHYWPSLPMRETGVTLHRALEGGAVPPGGAGEGPQYRCSCPRLATRKSPAAEKLRLLTKPTWRGQGRVRGSCSLLLPPREGRACPRWTPLPAPDLLVPVKHEL